ncbi:MAG: DUF4394 domain-containing protein, partial [Actinobacteria bacterium]|nr:DUF4394 domain-containing protein [Actinomycetota bacterium]
AHPDTGAIAFVDGVLTYAAGDSGAAVTPRVVGSAYTNSVAGATTTPPSARRRRTPRRRRSGSQRPSRRRSPRCFGAASPSGRPALRAARSRPGSSWARVRSAAAGRSRPTSPARRRSRSALRPRRRSSTPGTGR